MARLSGSMTRQATTGKIHSHQLNAVAQRSQASWHFHSRANSNDSRVLSQVGYVPFDHLVGRAAIIFFSIDGEQARWNRLFSRVR